MKWKSKSNKKFDENLQKRLDTFFDKIYEHYPLYKVTSLYRDHKKLSERNTELRRLAGYDNNVDFFDDFGFEYIYQSNVREETRIGKKELLKKLKEKHPKKILKLSELQDDETDLMYYAKKEGMSSKEFLIRHDLFRVESLSDIIEEIKETYPKGVTKVNHVDSRLRNRLKKFAQIEECSIKQLLIKHSIIIEESSSEFMNKTFYENAKISDDGRTLLEFSNKTLIEQLTIPAEIMFIEECAFSECKKILEIDLEVDSDLEIISDNAFSKCDLLKKINLTNAKNLKIIGKNAFIQCLNLQSIMLNIDNLSNVGKNAIANCTSLKNIFVIKENKQFGILAQYFDVSEFFTMVESMFFDFVGYDETAIVETAKARTNIAISRLKNPVSLKETHRDLYIYLIWNRILKTGNVELFVETEELILNSQNAEKYKKRASEKQLTEIVDKISIFIKNNIRDKELVFNEIKVKQKGKSQILVHFEDDSRYSYSSEIKVHVGDKVFVSGKKQGISGRVVKIEKTRNVPNFLEKVIEAYRIEIYNGTNIANDSINTKEEKYSKKENEVETGSEILKSIINDIELSIEEEYLFIDYKEGVKLIKYIGKSTIVEIPNVFNNRPVISIGEKAFFDCQTIQKVVIPHTVVSIDQEAFLNCKSLKSVILGEGITRIKYSTFGFCKSLKTVILPRLLETIEDASFYGCKSLEYIDLPKQLKYIGDASFTECVNLKSIYLTESIIYTGMAVFANCKALKSVNIPKGLNVIKRNMFSGCLSLEKVDVPDTVTKIEDGAFSKCENLDEIYIPDSVKEIGDWAFEGCSAISEITLPNSLISFGKQVFWYCSSLESFIVPSCVTEIADKDFYECTSLKEIVLPSSITSIGESAFDKCSSLKGIEIPDSVKSIGCFAFYYCKEIQEIKIPATIDVIEAGLFANCTLLENVTIPRNVKSICRSAFSDCKSLNHIEIPDKVELIESFAFTNCISLKEIHVPESVKFIDSYAFNNCSNLGTFTVSKENPFIGVLSNLLIQIEEENAVIIKYLGKKEIEINVPDTFRGYKVTKIDFSVFEEQSFIKNIKLPNSIESIGSNAFRRCTSLKSIVMPNNVFVIEENLFEHCTALVKAELPKNLHRISRSAFLNCSSLKTIVLPNSTEYIGNRAFEGCHSLESIYLSKNLEIAVSAFFKNDNIRRVYLSLPLEMLKHEYRIGETYLVPLESSTNKNLTDFKSIFYFPFSSELFPDDLLINDDKPISFYIKNGFEKMKSKSKAFVALYLLISNEYDQKNKEKYEKTINRNINHVVNYFIESKQTSLLKKIAELQLINRNNFYDIFDDIFTSLDVEDKKIILEVKQEILII